MCFHLLCTLYYWDYMFCLSCVMWYLLLIIGSSVMRKIVLLFMSKQFIDSHVSKFPLCILCVCVCSSSVMNELNLKVRRISTLFVNDCKNIWQDWYLLNPSYSYRYKKSQTRVKSSKNIQFNLAVEKLRHKLYAYWRVTSVPKQQAVIYKNADNGVVL